MSASLANTDPEQVTARSRLTPPVRRMSMLGNCLMAAGVSIVAIAVTYFIDPLRIRGSFLPLTAAVTIAAFYGGAIPSIVSIIVGALGWSFLVSPPIYSLSIARWDDLFRLMLFLLVASLISSLHASRVKAEAALRESQHRLSLALDAVQMGAWDYDIRTGVFWVSNRMRSIMGLDEDEPTSTYSGFLASVYPDDRPRVVQAMTCTLEDQDEYQVEHRVILPDKSIRWVMTRGRTFLNSRGEVERMVGVAVDISDRKLLQERGVAC